MDSLPQELINRIVQFSERYPGQEKWYSAIQQSVGHAELPSQFPRLAGLNRMWKEAVETITFHRLAIKSSNFGTFQSIVTGNRRKWLTRINFTALLSKYSDEACARVESRNEQQLNDGVFTKGVCDLFAFLKAWEEDGVRSPLQLYFDNAAVSPTDARAYQGQRADELMYDIATGKRADILSDRWERSGLHFLIPDMMPILCNVRHLNVTGHCSRALEPRIEPDLTMYMPKINSVHWEPQYYKIPPDSDSDSNPDSDSGSDSGSDVGASAKTPNARDESRMAFVAGLRRIEYQSLRPANIEFIHSSPTDQRRTYPSTIPTGLTYDPLSAALRNFSQNLTTFASSTHIDSTLFWPSPDEQNATTPT